MIVNRPEVRFKPLVFDYVPIANLDLLSPGDDPMQLYYDDIVFEPMNEVEHGDYLVLVPGEPAALHLKPHELERCFEPNTKDNWNEELVTVDQKGFEWALIHMKSGMPVKRRDDSDIIILDLIEGRFKRNGEDWHPTLDDLLYDQWEVALDFGDEI